MSLKQASTSWALVPYIVPNCFAFGVNLKLLCVATGFMPPGECYGCPASEHNEVRNCPPLLHEAGNSAVLIAVYASLRLLCSKQDTSQSFVFIKGIPPTDQSSTVVDEAGGSILDSPEPQACAYV